MPAQDNTYSISRIILIIVSLVLVFWSFWINGVFTGTTNVITWDAYGYYLYLPAIFNYQDLTTLSFIEAVHFPNYDASVGDPYQILKLENGNAVGIYTTGQAVLYLPFYLCAYVYAALSSYPNDGLSFPFQLAIVCASLFYTISGLVVLRSLLIRWQFRDKVIGWSLIGLVLGTNLFYYSGSTSGLTHSYLFGMYCYLLYYVVEWHRQPSVSNSFMIGLITVLLCLVRPSELVSVFIFIFYQVYSIDSLKEKIVFFWKNRFKIFLIIGVGLLGLMPQLLYWKMVTGHWIFNAYAYAKHEFHFSNPHIWEGLFSYRKGWLIYTPIMWFAICGLRLFYSRLPHLFWGCLLYFVSNIYWVLSWHMWWYASCFGMRALIQSYAIWAIPFTCTLAYLLNEKSNWWKKILIGIWLLLIPFNLFQMWQYMNGILAQDKMTKTFYWNVFGKTERNLMLRKYLDIDEQLLNKDKYSKTTLGSFNIDKIEFKENYKGVKAIVIKPNEFGGNISVQVTDKNRSKFQKNTWIEVSAHLANGGDLFMHTEAMLVLEIKRLNQQSKWVGVGFQKCIPLNEWSHFDYETELLSDLEKGDVLQSYIWNNSPDTIYLEAAEMHLIQP